MITYKDLATMKNVREGQCVQLDSAEGMPEADVLYYASNFSELFFYQYSEGKWAPYILIREVPWYLKVLLERGYMVATCRSDGYAKAVADTLTTFGVKDTAWIGNQDQQASPSTSSTETPAEESAPLKTPETSTATSPSPT